MESRCGLVSTAITAATVVASIRVESKIRALGLLCAGIVAAYFGIAVLARAMARRSRETLVVDLLKGEESAEDFSFHLSKARYKGGGHRKAVAENTITTELAVTQVQFVFLFRPC